MKISEIEVRMGKIDVEGEVIDKEEPREIRENLKVCNATLKDESGEIKLTLWNDEIKKVNVGDKVKVTNGYCNEFQGEKQLTAGKFGQLEVVGKEEEKAEEEKAD